MRLREPARTHASSEPGHSGVTHRSDDDIAHRLVLDIRVRTPASEQPQQMRLSRSVRPQNRHPLAEPDLDIEWLRETGEFELLAHDRALRSTTSAQPHAHLLLPRNARWRTRLLELPQASLGCLVARGEPVIELRLDLKCLDEGLELDVLLVPATMKLLKPGEPCRARFMEGREARAMYPRRVACRTKFDADDMTGCLVEQLTIM